MSEQNDEMIEIVTRGGETRGGNLKRLNLDDFASSVQIFLGKMTKVLEQAPSVMGEFQFDTVEIHAEVTAKGSIAILGTGGEAGATGGITFVFKRVISPQT